MPPKKTFEISPPRAPLLPFLLLAACAGQLPVVHLAPQPARDEAALAAAVEAYYAAPDAAGLRQAVQRAAAAGPDSPQYHELAASLALYEGREHESFEHLLAALASRDDDAALLHLHLASGYSLTLAEQARFEAVLGALVREHPRPDVRAAAAYALLGLCDLRGDDACRAAVGDRIGFALPLALIGPWDNEEGKGFDAPLPPRARGIFPGERYDGALVKVGWRLAPPRNSQNDYRLDELFTPSNWVVAYGAAAVTAAREGRYELRIGAPDPIKVWVNDQPVFEIRRVEAQMFDQWVLPVTLRAGVNRILLELGHREEGPWILNARLTGEGGAPAEGLSPATVDAAFAPGPAPGEVGSSQALIQARLTGLPRDSTRRLVHAVEWTRAMVGGPEEVVAAQELAARHPGGLHARYLYARSLWDNGDQDKTADLLAALDREAGDALPLLRLDRVRLLHQTDLLQQSRALLLGLQQSAPDRPGVWRELAELFRAEAWTEDRCAALEQLDRRWPGGTSSRLELARCWEALRYQDRADALYQSVLQALPRQPQALRARAELAAASADLDAAERLARAEVEAYPDDPGLWVKLAEILRRRHDGAGAGAALERALALNPDLPQAWSARAGLAYEAGDTARAVELWKTALARRPNDEHLANRLSFLAPGGSGSFEADIPGDEAIEAALALRSKVKPAPGTNVLYLLDHQVTRLAPDGSTRIVVTRVAQALNQEGRDALMSHQLAGFIRVLRAYSVDPAGRRTDATSIRWEDVRFRNLQVGSVVVLQYRIDQRPSGYLSRHLEESWPLQGAGEQRVLGQRVLFIPASARLHEAKLGDIAREESRVGDEVRISWTARDVPPLIPEVGMPPVSEVASAVWVSTLPDWDDLVRWEDALLQDAFHESPELVATADRLFQGVSDPQEKLRRLMAFLMEEIRYQMDYETWIAGVKPHPARVVLERGYGDCKDKAVLFVALARRAGIEAHIAMVQTRSYGAVHAEVPMETFNHSIAYVPPQPGLAQGRFFDPTADALDVDVLRDDDPGTLSVVFDPVTRKYALRQIPYQAPDMNRTSAELSLRVGADGSGEGELLTSATGKEGVALRRAARNPEQLQKLAQQRVAGLYPGATLVEKEVVEAKDLRKPAQLRMTLRMPALARAEGRTLRITPPSDGLPQAWFALAQRRYPLVLGVPSVRHRRLELALPAGMKPSRLPSEQKISASCLKLERSVQAEADRIRIDETLTYLCERIAPEQYTENRSALERMQRALQEELVLEPGAEVSGPGHRPGLNRRGSTRRS